MKQIRVFVLLAAALMLTGVLSAVSYNAGQLNYKNDAGQSIEKPSQFMGLSAYGPFYASATSSTAIAIIPSAALSYTGACKVQFASVSGSAEYDYGVALSLTVPVQAFPLAVSTTTITEYLAPGQGVRVQLAPLATGLSKNILYWILVYR